MLVAYTVAATLWLLFATAVGVLLAYKFGAPDFAPGEWQTFGRLRPIHTNATVYGWASLALVVLAIYAMVTIPYSRALVLWRGGEGIWYQNPRYAPPAWLNYFRTDKLPETIDLSSTNGTAPKTFTPGETMDETAITFTFNYPYADYPQDIAIYFTSNYTGKQPFVSLTWTTPDGRDIRLADFAVDAAETFYISQDTTLQRRLAGLEPQQGLFVADPKAGLT